MYLAALEAAGAALKFAVNAYQALEDYKRSLPPGSDERLELEEGVERLRLQLYAWLSYEPLNLSPKPREVES